MSASKKHSEYLTPIELLSASKLVGKIEPASEHQEFATFPLTVQGKPIALKGKGIVGSEVRASQFNPGKLQLNFDVSGNGEMLFAAEQLRKEIQGALDNECLPELEVVVQSWVKNKMIYLSWPKMRGNYLTVEVNGKSVKPGTENYEKFTEDLARIGNVDEDVEVGFSLYAWARYAKNTDATAVTKVTVGMTPTVEYIKYKSQ